jgi:hypothetical protein
MPGQVYRKLGTSVETQLMVFDKVQEDGEMIRVPVRDLDEALAYVDAVAATRPEIRTAQRATANPHARPVSPASAPRKRSAAPVAASKPRANAVCPLSFTSFDVPRDNAPVSDIYARDRPQRIEIAGAQEHPTPLVESIAMASVAPPAPSVRSAFSGVNVRVRMLAPDGVRVAAAFSCGAGGERGNESAASTAAFAALHVLPPPRCLRRPPPAL